MSGSAKSIPEIAIENEILALCNTNPKGINDKEIASKLPDIEIQQRVATINRLLTMGKIEVLKGKSGLIYRVKNAASSSGVIKDIDNNQERLVYQIIESAGNKGIWTREIRYKCNLMMTEVNKILKNLESKKIIKAVKSVAASKKKVYMLFNLTPDRSVTGGAWYSDQDFESEFVEVLNQQALKFLQQKKQLAEKDVGASPSTKITRSFASANEVNDFISKLGISKVSLTPEDIETILDTLLYDGKVERTVMPSANGQNRTLYRSIDPYIESCPTTRTPCAICPVFHQCHPGNIISPENCVYLTEWMEY